MRIARISALALTLMLLVSNAGAQAQDNKPRSTAWTFYTIKGEEFSVALPNYPSMHTIKEKGPRKDRLDVDSARVSFQSLSRLMIEG